ncbi:MAG: hypothetical protein M5U34_05740 [Chloroflexi bacterium]|nr:hypothetical protein [Chloroflexota bacterium]
MMGGQTAVGWLGFDPAVAQAANVGIFRLRWLAPGSDVTPSGDCTTLPIYAPISPTACYEMAQPDAPIYEQPIDTANVIATLPAGGYTAVISKNSQNWYKIDLGMVVWLPVTTAKSVGWRPTPLTLTANPAQTYRLLISLGARSARPHRADRLSALPGIKEKSHDENRTGKHRPCPGG